MKAEAYLNICGVPTKVVTWGRGLSEIRRTEEIHDIVLMIPGNPGYIAFYEEFLLELYERLGYSVWVISHAGHEIPNNPHQIIPDLSGNEALFDIPGQVTNKIAFIEQYIPPNARLHLIGHSIGAYIIIQLLKVPSIKIRVIGNYLLFPVFERLSQSPNGNIISNLKKFLCIGLLFARTFTILPIICQTFCMEIYGFFGAIPKKYRGICRDYIHPTRVEQLIAMVCSELDVVKDRDSELLTENKDIIKLYYGSSDGWAPLEYYYQLKQDLPYVNAQLCCHNFPHAFVLRHSKEVAKLVADWIEMKKI